MATANFNTQIVSSDSNGGIKSYSLDNVINKDFEGPYDYNFNTEVPDGISIQITDKFGYILVISPNIEFELPIVVTQSGVADPDFAIATTMITIEETPAANFNTEILSSNSNEVLSYNLDEVIDKNFSPVTGGYFYYLLDLVPMGFSIMGNTLFVPPFTNFNGLSVVVSDNGGIDPIEAIATTNVTVESPVNAEFNTEILSSRQDGKELSYNLDMVIDKNFEGPYNYTLDNGSKVPIGVSIKDDNTLIIPSNVEFRLVVTVYDEGKINVTKVGTDVVLEPDPFIEEITKLLNNKTLQEKFSNTKNDWAKIINRGTNEKVDDGIIYPGDDLVKPL
jgi:hypothetical protein